MEPKDFGKWATKVFSLQIGEIAGPVKMDSMLVFLQCIGKQPSGVRNYEEARADVEETVKYLAWTQFQESKVSEFGQSIRSLKVFSERLKELKIN